MRRGTASSCEEGGTFHWQPALQQASEAFKPSHIYMTSNLVPLLYGPHPHYYKHTRCHESAPQHETADLTTSGGLPIAKLREAKSKDGPTRPQATYPMLSTYVYMVMESVMAWSGQVVSDLDADLPPLDV